MMDVLVRLAWIGLAGFAIIACRHKESARVPDAATEAAPPSPEAGDCAPEPGEVGVEDDGVLSDQDYARFISATNNLGVTVFKKLEPVRGNLLFSPVSLAASLGMAYVGAGGKTADQMAEPLHGRLNRDQYGAAVRRMATEAEFGPGLIDSDSSYGSRWVVSRSLWLDHRISAAPAYTTTLRRWFGAEIGSIDAADPTEASTRLNRWVREKTSGRISVAFPEHSIRE